MQANDKQHVIEFCSLVKLRLVACSLLLRIRYLSYSVYTTVESLSALLVVCDGLINSEVHCGSVSEHQRAKSEFEGMRFNFS